MEISDEQFNKLATKDDIDSIRGEFRSSIKLLDEKISENVEKIDALDSKLVQNTERINALDSKFTGKIDALDSKFTGKIDALDSKFTGKIDALDSKFTGRIDAVMEQVAKNTEMIGANKEHIERLEQKFDVNHGEVMTVILGMQSDIRAINNRMEFERAERRLIDWLCVRVDVLEKRAGVVPVTIPE